MKRMIFGALLMTVISIASFSREFVAGGKSNSALGDYKIEMSDNPVVINGEKLKTFIISYQNSPMEVTVVIQKGKKCKNYIVLSDKLSIQYVCNESYFGVQKLDPAYEKEGFKTEDFALNRGEYFHQKVISRGKHEEIESAHLIAAYFPMLMLDKEKGNSVI
jgi:hypothetical protein